METRRIEFFWTRYIEAQRVYYEYYGGKDKSGKERRKKTTERHKNVGNIKTLFICLPNYEAIKRLVEKKEKNGCSDKPLD